jgi:hypothetical protein
VSIGRANFDDISEADLNDLIRAGVTEGLTIDYKRDAYGSKDADKKEALKDITSFANSAGGHLIIGMKEAKGVPTAPTGLPNVDPDALINRLESLVRDGVEPRLVGVRMRAVGLSGGGAALVIRIPRSWNPPHRVSSAGTNRFYVRNSGGAHEASVEELRVLFTLAADAQRRIKTFRSERIAAIVAGRGPVIVPANGRMIVHLVPLSAFGQAAQIDLERAYEGLVLFRPMSSSGMTTRFNLDGFVNVCDGGRWLSYTQVFRNGILEATQGGIVRERGGMAFLHEGSRDLAQVLPSYFEGVRELGVPAPIIVMISYEGVMGARLGVRLDWHADAEDIAPFPPLDPLLLPEMIVEDYGPSEHYVRMLRPIFDALWNAAGFRRCTYFDAEGNWNAPH